MEFILKRKKKKYIYYTLFIVLFGGTLYFIIPMVFNAISIVNKFPSIGNVNRVDTVRNLPSKIFLATNVKTGTKDTISLVGLQLVNNWATWCVPCRNELPELDSLELIYPNLNIWLVSHDSPENLKDFNYSALSRLESYALNDTLYFKKKESVPVTYLIKDGSVIKTFYGRQQWLSSDIKHVIDSIILD